VIAERWDAAMRALRRYHQYEVIGAETVPRTGGVVVASTHSLATYENFMLGSVSLELLGRRPLIVGDDWFFRIPLVRDVAREIGLVAGDRETVIEMLRSGEIIGLGPGGMREAIRSSRDKYKFDWTGRLGFVWVSMLAGVPIVLAACPGADDIYTVYDSPLTVAAYRRLKVPLPLFRGIGPTPLPRPVKLVHVLDEPIEPPVPPSAVTEQHVARHHAYLVERMTALMDRAIALQGDAPRAEPASAFA
jgi:1-acyl-sn-glycerol-3-phosphate acyltransferase